MASDGDPPALDCPACRSEVPAATFCGRCGARLDAPADAWSILLRPGVFANAHREPVWLPRVSSTLFPRLPGAARRPFRAGLILVVVAVVVLAVARVNGPLGVMAVIGWPLLFLIYVWQSGVFRDIPARILLTAMLLGIVLGAGAWLAAGEFVAGSYGVSTGSSFLLLGRELEAGFLVSLGGALLMLIPAVVTRLFAVPERESLDGFVIGAFGALWYSTAAATTILAPQFTEGLLEGQPPDRMLQDAISYGIVSAVVTTAAGGVVGATLWFAPCRRAGRDPWHARAALTLCSLLALGCYVAVWAVDAQGLPRFFDIGAKAGLALLALLVVRCAVQVALLHEIPDPATGDPVLCVHCLRVVPDMPFCVACGAAAQASSRTSRQLRRQYPPVRGQPTG